MIQVKEGALRRRSLLAAAATLAAPGILRAQTPTKATFGLLRFVSAGPALLAKDRGHFAAEGLDVELRFFDAAQPVAVAVSAGSLDAGCTANSAGSFNLAGKGALKVIGSQFTEKKGYPGNVLMASLAAHQAGFDAPEKVLGRTLAITQVGSSFHYIAGQLAERFGGKMADIRMRPLQTVSNLVSALKTSQVEGALVPPHIANLLAAGNEAIRICPASDYVEYQGGALFTQAAHVANRPDLVARIARAFQRGAAEYYAALVVPKPERRGTEAVIKTLLATVPVGNQPLAEIEAGAFYVDPQARVDVADIARQVAWYQSQGAVDPGVQVAAFVDTSFIPPLA